MTTPAFKALCNRATHAALKRVVGIDLGTTNSTVAQIRLPLGEEANPELACECVSIEQMTRSGPYYGALVPSVLAIDKEGKEWIGEGAKRMRAQAQAEGLSLEKNLFYETKNDMGLSRTYHRAGESYDHARKIAGHLLKFLAHGARQASGHVASRTVVTVPASFQLAQRADTMKATQVAGLQVEDQDLLDEPVAALTDYLFTYADDGLVKEPSNIVVFDFGGGTCDVFVARIKPGDSVGDIRVEARAVSRYSRLGGSDLDAAIVHEILIPALLKDNQLSPRHFEWAERKKVIEPALRGCAEALKEGLCREIAQLSLHWRYEAADKNTVAARQMATQVRVGGKEYTLANPTLTASAWEELLKPFLSADLLHVRETAYRQTLSIFAPISDALERAKMPVSDVHLVLLAGGSSLIPQVRWAVENYFKGSKILGFPDSTAAQTAIARGAAWSAAWLTVTGSPFVQPVTSSTIALRAAGKKEIQLIEVGTAIPHPTDGTWINKPGFTLPKNFKGTLKVEVVSLPDEQVLLNMHLELDRKYAGEGLVFEYRFTASRCFECRVGVQSAPQTIQEARVENPLVNVANPGAARMEIETIEEELREAGTLVAKHRKPLERLAALYREVRMPEKAVEVLKSAIRVNGRADAGLLNSQALIYEELGDFNRMETCFREAAQAGDWGGPMFNWSLHCIRQQRLPDALQKIDEALIQEPDSGPYHILRARTLSLLGRKDAAVEAAKTGLEFFDPVGEQTTWELHWYEIGAGLLGRQDLIAQAKAAATTQTKSGAKHTTTDEEQAPEYRG